MSKVSENPNGMDDYVITVSETELEALRELARSGDGRKTEVKIARRVLGVN